MRDQTKRRRPRRVALAWFVIGLATVTGPIAFSFTSGTSGMAVPVQAHTLLAPVETPGLPLKLSTGHANLLANSVAIVDKSSGRSGPWAVFVPLALSTSASAALLPSRKRPTSQLGSYALVIFIITMLILVLCPSSALAGMATPAGQSSLLSVLKVAGLKAFRSGKGGFLAGICQVLAFMWLRTAMNYQYKNGGTLAQTLSILWAEGGIRRLYQGFLPWGLVQAPLSRFGDTAANSFVMGLRDVAFPWLPLGCATVLGSLCGAVWKVVITPIDCCKTAMQTDGADGGHMLKEKIAKGGIRVLWYGWEGNYLASVLGGYPFFAVFNLLSYHLPVVSGMWMGLLRNAFIGAAGATASDLCSNSIRVVTTKKQTSQDTNLGYFGAAREIIASDGMLGLMTRGLGTRIFTNILQGALFTVLWRGLLHK